MLNRIKIIFSLFVITLPFAGIGQEITARVAGLENDSTYMSLLKKEQLLRHTEDSIVQTINTTRQLFTSDIPESEKEQYATKILQLEKELFEVRNQQGITTNEISVIEQDFILKNLNGTGGNVTEQTVEPATPISKRIFPMRTTRLFAALKNSKRSRSCCLADIWTPTERSIH